MAPSSTASTNPLTEVAISLGGVTYRVAPTYRKLVRIEAVLGEPCIDLGWRCEAGATLPGQRGGVKSVSMSEAVTILGLMFEGVPDTPKPAEIGEILMEEGGLLQLLIPMRDYLARTVAGNKTYAQEMRAKAEVEGTASVAAENPPQTPGS